MPATSIALARNKVVVLLATDAVSPGVLNSVAGPEATGVPVQPAVVYSATVEPLAAKPFTLGSLLLAGELGSVSLILGAAGAAESSK